MLTPTHAQPQRRPSELFTNRERAKAQFKRALDTPQGANEYRVLLWCGVGGQGKTALLEEFERILKRRNEIARGLSATRPGYALIDFNINSNRSIAAAMLAIREKLGKTAELQFNAFDTAYLRYVMITQPGTNTKALHAQLFSTGSEFLDGLIQAMGSAGELGAAHLLPGFNLISKYGSKVVGKAAHAFHDWWRLRGTSVLYGIDDLSQDALLRKLPTYLGADIVEALNARQPPRLIIMLDTYEALWRGYGLKDGPGAQRIDDWVRLLVQEAPGVLFVIAGRDKLQWQAIDKEAGWDGIIELHQLGGLTRPDSETLLGKWDIVEAEIRARMIDGARTQEFGETDPADRMTEAYLPFYLELQAKTYGNIKAGGRIPKPEDFGGDQPQILARFMEHLDSDIDKLLRVASYPAVLDPTLLDMLGDKFLGGRASVDWSRLYARSLVSDERDGVCFLHDLLRKALQDRERKERPALYHDIHQALFTWFKVQCGSEKLNTLTQEQERALLAAIRHLSRVDEREAVRWADGQMRRLNESGRWRTLEEACQLVLPLAELGFGAENEWTTTILSWLASASQSNGRYADAEVLYERVRAVQEKVLGPEHPSTATTLADLAGVYRDTSRYADAEALYERVRAIEEKTLGPEHPSNVTTLGNLAVVYSDTGRYADAEALYERVRAIEEKTLGPEHPWTATTLANLAGVYRDTGRYADAEALYERVRAIEEKTLGPEHPWTATTLANLAGVYRDTGRYADAEALYERVRAIEEKSLGPEHPWTAMTLGNLAGVYRDTGRHADAEALYERVRAIEEKSLGPEHPWTAMTLGNLAGVYRDTGRHADAEALYERVRAIEEKTLGPEHPWTATTLGNLAGVYRDTGRYADAEALYERVRAIEEKTLGPEHPSTATTLANLAGVYRDTGRYADAEALYERVRAIEEKTLGPEHPSTATTLANLAGVYRDTGRYADAEALYKRARAIYEKSLGPEHPWTAMTLGNLAVVYSDTGRYADAEALYERVRAIEEKTLGPEHPWTATTLGNLAGVYRDTGRYADAEALYERVRAIEEKTLGLEHPSTATTLVNLAGVYRDTGRYAEAEHLLALALRVLSARLPPRHPRLARLLVQRGKLHAVSGHNQQAAEDFSEALAAFEGAGVRPEYRWAREARENREKL